jgi:hypothetical protein
LSSTIPDPSRERIPVERRVLGLDRRSFPHAFTVVAVFLVSTVVLPRIDDAVDWDDPVRAGERLALTDTIVFTPTPGWEVEEGFRLPAGGSPDDSGRATVAGDGVVFSVVPDDFEGTPAELIEQIEKVTSSTEDPSFQVSDEPDTVTTASGEVGVVQSYSSIRGDGVIAAFVLDGTGVEITAYGPPAQLRAAATDITDMITSVDTDGDDS